MRIELLRPALNSDYLFQIRENSKVLLNSADYCTKTDCLDQIQTVLLDLRDNEQINISTGNYGQFYFEVANLAQSASFEDIELASDALARLKSFASEAEKFSVFYNKSSQQVVSKKQLGLRAEAYDFSKKSISKKPGFELINVTIPNGKYFHFNDKKGNPILFSRVFDGKTRRIKAIRSIIKNIKKEGFFQIIQQPQGALFIIKNPDGHEIARSKTFKNQIELEKAIALIQSIAPKFKKDFPIPIKKKKKRKAKEKYHLKQVAPRGLVGFEGFKSEKNKLHYFHYHDAGGQALLYSKAYEKRSQREVGIAYVLKNGGKKKLYKTWKKGKKQHYFSILGQKGKSLARSRYFDSKNEMVAAIQHLQQNAGGFQQELNYLPTIEEKKYTITLPEQATDEITQTAKIVVAKAIQPKVEAIDQQKKKPEIIEEIEVATDQEVPVEEIEKIEEESEKSEGIILEKEPVQESIVAVKTKIPPVPKVTYEPPNIIEQPKIIEEEPSNGFPWKWLLLGLIGTALLGLIWKNCGQSQAVMPPPVLEPKVEETKPTRPEPIVPANLGPTSLELNLKPNTAEARIADFLSTPKVKIPKTFILESVQFPFNSSELTNNSFNQLNHVVRVLKEYPNAKIEINGHTDSKGNNDRNLVLSENRAKAVQNYLSNKGIEASRMLKAVGFGESDPIATNETDKGRQENRRSEIVVVER